MSQGMQRREFLRRSAWVAAGVVAADQLDLLDRLGWKRKLFAAWGRPRLWGDSDHDDSDALEWYARNGVLVPEGRDYLISRQLNLGAIDRISAGRISLRYDRRRGQSFHGWTRDLVPANVGVNFRWNDPMPDRMRIRTIGEVYGTPHKKKFW